MTRILLLRHAVGRQLVLLAMRVLPPEADWPVDRLRTVNESLKTRSKLIRDARRRT